MERCGINPVDERSRKNEFKGSGGLSLTALRAAFRVREKSREALPKRCERQYALFNCPGRVKAGLYTSTDPATTEDFVLWNLRVPASSPLTYSLHASPP